jgi:hypothetical protein
MRETIIALLITIGSILCFVILPIFSEFYVCYILLPCFFVGVAIYMFFDIRKAVKEYGKPLI